MNLTPIESIVLHAYLDDELDPDERARVEQLIQENADIRNQLEHIQQIRDELKTAFETIDDLSTPKDKVWQRLQKHIAQQINKRHNNPFGGNTVKCSGVLLSFLFGGGIFKCSGALLSFLLIMIIMPFLFSTSGRHVPIKPFDVHASSMENTPQNDVCVVFVSVPFETEQLYRSHDPVNIQVFVTSYPYRSTLVIINT